METTDLMQSRSDLLRLSRECSMKYHRSAIEMAQVLEKIKQAKAWKFSDCGGYGTWKEFLETELRIPSGHVSRLLSVVKVFINQLGMSVEKIAAAGLTNADALIPYILNHKDDPDFNQKLDQVSLKSISEVHDFVSGHVTKPEKKEKGISPRDVFIDQFISQYTESLGCSRADLMFNLAVYFTGMNADMISKRIRSKRTRLTEDPEQLLWTTASDEPEGD